MAAETATEYRRIRKEHPYLSASQAILWARGNLRPTVLTWTTFEGHHVGVGTGTQDGFEVRAEINYDDGAMYDIGFTSDDTGIRNPNFRWRDYDRYGDRNKFVSLPSGTVRELADCYHKAGDARHVAWERARESLQDEAESYIDNRVMVVYGRVFVGVNGIRVGESSSIGTELDDNDRHLEKSMDDFIQETGLIEEAIEEARENLASIIETTRHNVDALEALTK